jgi:hypothetical protein
VLAAFALAGCFADPTEVVVVVDTDATPFTDFGEIQFTFGGGSFGFASVAKASPLPATMGVVPGDDHGSFDLSVTLTPPGQRFPGMTPATNPFATRKASEVPFVKGSMRVLFLPILKECACTQISGVTSTNCPHALDPECRDLTAPPLPEFDDDDVPHLPR